MLRPPGRFLRPRPPLGLEFRLQRLQPLLQGRLLGSAPGSVFLPADRGLSSGLLLPEVFTSGFFAPRRAGLSVPRLQAFLQGRRRPLPERGARLRPASRVLSRPGLHRALPRAGARRSLDIFQR